MRSINMKKYALISALVLATAAFGQKSLPFNEIAARFGGFMIDTRAQKGRLVIVNAQTEVSADTVAAATAMFEKDAHIRIDHEKGAFDLKSAKRIGEATVYVISDETLPVTLIAADDRWGFVNVAKLRTDKPQFFTSRVHKGIVRVAGLVLGAGDSGLYPFCLTGHIKSPEDLDQTPTVQLPVDVMDRLFKAMDGIGIHPYTRTTYRAACEQGWAPAPTNAIQKAVWDKVHSIPDKPMKIQFDPATQKGKVTK